MHQSRPIPIGIFKTTVWLTANANSLLFHGNKEMICMKREPNFYHFNLPSEVAGVGTLG